MAIDRDRLTSLAKDLNLTFTAFGDPMIVDSPLVPSKGSLVLSDAFGNQLEPAPRTPIKGEEAGPYKFLSGTIKAAYNAHRALEGDNIAVSPGMSTGNTGTMDLYTNEASPANTTWKRYKVLLETDSPYLPL